MSMGTEAGTLRTPPRLVSSALLGTAVYLMSVLMLFGGFVSAYLVLRGSFEAWPPTGQPRLPLGISAINLLVLLASGASLWRSWIGRLRPSAARWLQVAAILGLIFVGVQGLEWFRLVRYGFRMSTGPYAGTFYALVGAHALHAIGGLFVLAVTARRVAAGRPHSAACNLYWSFVVLLWPGLYALLYLV